MHEQIARRFNLNSLSIAIVTDHLAGDTTRKENLGQPPNPSSLELEHAVPVRLGRPNVSAVEGDAPRLQRQKCHHYTVTRPKYIRENASRNPHIGTIERDTVWPSRGRKRAQYHTIAGSQLSERVATAIRHPHVGAIKSYAERVTADRECAEHFSVGC